MAQGDRPPQEPSLTADNGSANTNLWRRLFGRANGAPGSPETAATGQSSQSDDELKPGLIRRVSRRVVPGLPRAQTFTRQQSELRDNLEPVQPTPAERRALSADRRQHSSKDVSQTRSHPRSSAPDFGLHSSTDHSLDHTCSEIPYGPSPPPFQVGSEADTAVDGMHWIGMPFTKEPQRDQDAGYVEDSLGPDATHFPDAASMADCRSITTSDYDAMIRGELETTWILNLSMHFRDKSKREKFFVTYRDPRELPTIWRRVTVSVDYRDAPENSLERELAHIKLQRDKIARIYDAIRESLADIQFYSTVTNLKLQTTEGRLHVHVVVDVNEVIHYPPVRMIQHLRCPRVRESDIQFVAHMSGFVYKVKVNGQVLIKKEIPGPETVDEFLYEVNALNRLKHSQNVIRFHGVIVDDEEEYVKGLLISYAEQGALIDVIYDQEHPMSWPTREKWAKQIISGLSEIHEAGFVQGDLTLSNIVIDEHDNAKIIDINRRGCPVGWEPPEATPLIENSQRISMYIGVKSDLYQLGMVLWAVAMKEDEPEAHGRPLYIGSNALDVPDWYRTIVDICLSEDPRDRLQALNLLSFFPEREEMDALFNHPSISVDDGETRKEYFVDSSTNGYPQVRTVHPSSDWSYVGWSPSYLHSPKDDPNFYPARGRSPPSPLPSNLGEYEPPRYDRSSDVESSRYEETNTATCENNTTVFEHLPDNRRSTTPRMGKRSGTGLEEDVKSDIEKPIEVNGRTEAKVTTEEGSNSMDPFGKNEYSTGTGLPRERRQGVTEEGQVQSTEYFNELEGTQHNRDDSANPLEAGNTVPEPENNSNREHPYDLLDASTARDIEHDTLDERQGSTHNGTQSACMERVEGEPASVPLPPSGPASETTEKATCISKGGMEEDEGPKATVPTADIIPRTPSPTSRHSGSSSTLRDLPDDLKGVGSTYDLMSEKRLLSINDDDLTMFLTTDIT